MGFYHLSKKERQKLVQKMDESIKNDLKGNKSDNILNYASDEDTYIRKNAYLYLARTYRDQEALKAKVSDTLEEMYNSGDEKIRQTAVYSGGDWENPC